MTSQYPVLNGRPIDQWKVAELKEELRKRKLPIRGLKDDLIKRLDEAILSERAIEKEEEAIQNESNSVKEKVGNGFDSGPEPSVYKVMETQPIDTPIVEDTRKNIENKTIKLDVCEVVLDKKEEAIRGERDSTEEKVGNGFDCNPEPLVFEVGVTKPTNSPIVEDARENTENKTRKLEHDEAVVNMEEEAIQNESDSTKEKIGNKSDCNPEPQVSEVGETRSIDGLIVEDARENSENKSRELEDDEAMVDVGAIDDSSSVLGQGRAHDVESMDCSDSTAAIGDPVVVAVSVETNITVTQSSVTEVVSSGQELQNKEADMDPEVPDHPSRDSTLDLSNQIAINSQVSEVSRDLGFQVRSDSISTDSVSINEKNELKDNLNADNFHIEQNVVMPETVQVQPSSNDGAMHPTDGQEPCENQGSMEGEDDSNAKKNEATDDRSLEKLNVGQSSGDQSVGDILESRNVSSIHNFDDIGEKNNLTEVQDVKEGSSVNVTLNDVSDIDISSAEKISLVTEKRKLEDQEVVKNDEPPKRQRKWNSETLKVPEPQTSNLKPTTPRDASPSTISKRSFTKSDLTLRSGNVQERVVPPSSKPPTTSLRVDNFLRPFTLKALQELLGKTGAVCSFWMDHIKTHCYVTYSSVEEAMETRNALYNLQWPSNGGKLLVADFVDPQEVKMRAEAPSPVAAPISTTPKISPPSAPSSSSKPPAKASPVQQVARQQLPPPPPPPPMTSNQPPPTKERLPIPHPLMNNPDPPIVTLDDLFRKTRSTPRIYYLPLSEEQVGAKLATQVKNTK